MISLSILSNQSGSEFKIVSYGNRNTLVESVVLTLASSGGAYEFPIFDMAVSQTVISSFKAAPE